MTVPEARRDARLRRYPLRRHRLPVAGGTLAIVAPDSGDWLHTGGWSEQTRLGEEPPYWADIWPASVAVARWLCRRGDLSGTRMLDLGCGIGLPGTAAARQGADVLFCDREIDALAFAAFNAARQGGGGRHQTLQFDWHRDAVAGTFDLVALADVTYRPVHHLPILRQIHSCLGHDGCALHADPFRRESEGFLALARQQFANHSLAIETHFGDRRTPMRMTFLARSESALAYWLQSRTAAMGRQRAEPLESGR